MNRKALYVILLVIGILLLGSFREFTFLNINFQLQYMYYDTEYYRVAPFFHFLNNFEYSTIYYSKWLLTGGFALAFLILSVLMIKVLFNQRRLITITVASYIILCTVAAISYALGKLAGSTDTGYTIARFLMGLLQSPVVLMFLVLAFKLQKVPQT